MTLRPWKLLPLILILGLACAQANGADAASATPQQPPAARKPIVADEGLPMVKEWKPAEFPAGVPEDVMKGNAVLRVIVDEKGAIAKSRVLKASRPEFGEAALEALKHWVFSPGVSMGKDAAVCVDVPFEFRRGANQKHGLLPPANQMPREIRVTKAELIDGPLNDYPPSLLGRGLLGRVVYTCKVGPDGKPLSLRIHQASHADFIVPVMESYRSWRFKPAMQGDLPVSTEMVGDVQYGDMLNTRRGDALRANGITPVEGQEPDVWPQPTGIAETAWPVDLMLKGEGGSATVEFCVGINGVVKDIKVIEASHPDCGAALVAAMELWSFSAAMANSRGVEVTLRRTARFEPIPDTATDESDPVARLVRRMRKEPVPGGKGLDRPITPIFRLPPEKPYGSPGSEKAQVQLEFIIDRNGRLRLPRILSANKEQYGWAAATALAQWVFEPPTRGGEPTDVRVQVPVEF